MGRNYDTVMNQKSFTLIELMVVIAIIGILLGIGIPSYGRYNQESKLRQEKERVVDALDYARTKALAPDPITCNSNEEESYVFESNLASFSIKECCKSASGDTLGACNVANTTYSFPTTISRTAGNSPIIFYSLSKGSNGTSPAIRLKNTSISKCLDVSVSTSGAITVSDVGC